MRSSHHPQLCGHDLWEERSPSSLSPRPRDRLACLLSGCTHKLCKTEGRRCNSTCLVTLHGQSRPFLSFVSACAFDSSQWWTMVHSRYQIPESLLLWSCSLVSEMSIPIKPDLSFSLFIVLEIVEFVPSHMVVLGKKAEMKFAQGIYHWENLTSLGVMTSILLFCPYKT